MIIPLVHLNGTSKEELIRQLDDARIATMQALEVLTQSYPNRRDYYPLGDDAWKQAVAEYESRYKRLNSVCVELQDMVEKILD